MPNFLCKLGLHKWRYEDAVIAIRDEDEGDWASKANDAERRWSVGSGAYIPKPISIGRQETEKNETILTKRECLRCGVKQERRISEDVQGNITSISGWEKTKKQ